MKINSIVLRNNYSGDGKLISQAGRGELCQDGRATDNRKKPGASRYLFCKYETRKTLLGLHCAAQSDLWL